MGEKVKALVGYIFAGISDKPSGKTILYTAETIDELKVLPKAYESIQEEERLTESKINQKHRKVVKPFFFKKSIQNQQCFKCGSKDHQKDSCTSEIYFFQCNQKLTEYFKSLWCISR